jgi:hypothetical protein
MSTLVSGLAPRFPASPLILAIEAFVHCHQTTTRTEKIEAIVTTVNTTHDSFPVYYI